MANISSTLTPYCKTGITNFSCSLKPSIASSQIYNLTFTPSCLPNCNSFSFSINNLKNPSYLNPNASPISVQSVNSDFTGVIDSN